MTMTGMIITTMTAHISHHSTPFSPAFLAATMIGMVCTLAVARNTAKRYSFQFRMSVSSVVAARPGRVSGSTISQKMPKRVAPSSCADSSSSIGQTGEEVVHQPDDDRQVGDRIDEDQRQMRVEHAHRLEHHIDRDHHHDRRQDALRDDPEQDVAVAKRVLEVLAEGAGQEEEQRQRHGRWRPTRECRRSWWRRSRAGERRRTSGCCRTSACTGCAPAHRPPWTRRQRRGRSTATLTTMEFVKARIDLADLRLHRRGGDTNGETMKTKEL